MDLVESGLGKLQLAVENSSNDNYEDLVVELWLEGDVWAYFDKDEAEEGFRFPAEPEPWGPRKSNPFAGFGLSRDLVARVPVGLLTRRGEIKNNQSTHITFDSVSIRPRRGVELDDVHLFVVHSHEAELRGTWSATARNRSGEATGDLVIPLAAPLTPLQLEDLTDPASRG